MEYLKCWESDEHVKLFDYRMYFPSFRLKQIYNNFNEFRLVERFISKKERIFLLDVGCATGEVYRYFKYNYPKLNYIGCDISKAAIEKARIKYPKGAFLITDFSLSQIKGLNPDYLFCRDVIPHLENPFDFIKLLCSIPKRGLILRLRTRDGGKTVLDVKQSCKLSYRTWIPYIILNCDEIISLLKSLDKCSKIIFLKNYMPLGGFSHRYLPKDCYLEVTGTAETAMYIELIGRHKSIEIITEARKDANPPSIPDRFLHRVIKSIIGLEYKSSVWW